MADRYLNDIVEAIERIHERIVDVPVEAFERDWQRRWLVERGIEIVSAASLHLSDELKARHPIVPWADVAAIGDLTRYEHRHEAAPRILQMARDHLPELERICREELSRAQQPPEPRVKPIIIGSAEDVLVEKKRGWWRR